MERICFECMTDPGIRELIGADAEDGSCDACNQEKKCVPLELVGDTVMGSIRDAYEHGELDLYNGDSFGEELQFILQEELEIEYEAAEIIAEYLIDNDGAYIPHGEEPFFGSDATYVRKPPSSWENHYNWRHFSDRIKHRARFFGPVKSFMEELFRLPQAFPRARRPEQISLFEGFEEQNENDDLPIRILPSGKDSMLYRARTAEDIAEWRKFKKSPQTELSYHPAGPPAGRMNAEGVPVFYCALSEETAIKELRPTVGRMVVVGQFEPLRDLRLLDLTMLGKKSANSIFSPVYAERSSKINFLARFDSIVSKPVQPHHEKLEYLPTQVVAEYVHHVLGLDGLVYSSAQENGECEEHQKNIAIFGCSGWIVRNFDEAAASVPVGVSNESTNFSFFGEEQTFKEELLGTRPEDVTVHEIRGVRYEIAPAHDPLYGIDFDDISDETEYHRVINGGSEES